MNYSPWVAESDTTERLRAAPPTRTCRVDTELCSVFCASLDGRGFWGRTDTCVCMAESPTSSPETTTILLIRYTPVQNKMV